MSRPFNPDDSPLDEDIAEILQTLSQMDVRLANIERIVTDFEKRAIRLVQIAKVAGVWRPFEP